MAKSINELTVTDLIDFLKKVDRQIWIQVAAGFGIVCLVSFFFIWPAFFVRASIKDKIRTLESKIYKVDTLRGQKDKMLKSKEEAHLFIQQAKDRIFPPGDVSLLLGSISRLAEEAGVSIVASSPQSTKTEFPSPFNLDYRAHLYDFIVEGSYHGIGTFINQVEVNPKVLRVQALHLRPSETDAESQIANITLSATSFIPEEEKKKNAEKAEKSKKKKKKKSKKK